MASDLELENQCVPIKILRRSYCQWVIKVLVIGVGGVKEYRNDKNEGLLWLLTFVDEEGTKIQTKIFNQLVEKWKGQLEPNKTYYIINGIVNGVNPNYPSVNKELEISFSTTTVVHECKNEFSTVSFSNSFTCFEEASQLIDGSLFDIVGVVVKAKPSIGEGKKKQKEIVIMNQKYDRIIVTLWAELAENEGAMLEKLILENPIVGLCDVKGTTYRGEFKISTSLVSTILINPTFELAKALQNWHDKVKAENKDITLMPSKLIKDAKLLKLVNIIEDSFDTTKDIHYKFNATIKTLTNKVDPWYSSCKKCFKKVDVVNDVGRCPRCGTVEYEDRYLLKLVVEDNTKQHCYVSLFEGARYLTGCDIMTYKKSISDKKEESIFYRKLLLSHHKEFTFLFKMDAKNQRDRFGRSLVIEELHEIGQVGAIENRR